MFESYSLNVEKTDIIFNVATKEVLKITAENDILNHAKEGELLYDKFVTERIVGIKSIWSRMTKRMLKTFKTNVKIIKVKLKDKVVQLKEERNLMSRFIIASRVRNEINLPDIFGKYEFSVVPLSMFSADGNLLYCTDKALVMGQIETMMCGGKDDTAEEENPEFAVDQQMKNLITMMLNEFIEVVELKINENNDSEDKERVIILDGMALVNRVKKMPDIKTCQDFSDLFLQKVSYEISGFQTVVLTSDRYVNLSLKGMTREKRSGEECVRFKITDDTNIERTTLTKFLSHSQTKQDLTAYLGKKATKYFEELPLRYAVVYDTLCITNIQPLKLNMPDHTQEEADTLMVLYANYMASENPSQELYILSSDTDVLLLLIYNYPSLCSKTIFRTGKGENIRDINIKTAHNKIGVDHARAILGFHALTGCDQAAKFCRKSKALC